MCRCLYCYKPLKEGERGFHPQCARKFFGLREAPVLPYTRKNLNELALITDKVYSIIAGYHQ